MRDLSSCTILIVDDTDANVDILVETLGDDYDISVAMDGESALDYLSEALPDLILLDIMMPGLNGYEVIARLKAHERTREVPVIFCTAMTEIAHETKGLELGAVDYIRKPFSPPMVKARVRNHLRLKLAQEDLVERNEILRENTRLREEVERITRHDLKSSLNAVINVPPLLMMDGNLTAKQVELLQILEKSGYRMLEIINSSLDLYKMEIGRYIPKEVPVDLLKLIRQISGELGELMRSKGLNLSVRLRNGWVSNNERFIAAGEELLCYSMLANLIKNAVEASPENETVTVTLDDTAGPHLSIHNRGLVPAGIRDRFFDKYSTYGKDGGTGLGTYSAHLIAQTLGGRIDFETSEQDGTTLNIYLKEYLIPGLVEFTAEEEADPGAKDHRPAADVVFPSDLSRHLPVLVVDDYAHMRRTIISIMMQMGFSSFLEAADGLAAKEVLEKRQVSLVISADNLPRMTGLDLLRFVRGEPNLRKTPFILVVGEWARENGGEMVRGLADEYIIKPFSVDSLMSGVEKQLVQSHALGE